MGQMQRQKLTDGLLPEAYHPPSQNTEKSILVCAMAQIH